MILRSQGLNDVGWTLQSNIHVEEQYVEKKEVILEKFCDRQYGVERSTHNSFLRFLVTFASRCQFLLIYRSPWEVVDSFIVEGMKYFQQLS